MVWLGKKWEKRAPQGYEEGNMLLVWGGHKANWYGWQTCIRRANLIGRTGIGELALGERSKYRVD